MAESRPFHENINELILLFKKLKNNKTQLQMKDIDVSFIGDFEILIENYDLIRSTFSPEMLDSMNSPISELLDLLVQQLKEELEHIVVEANIDDLQNDVQLQSDIEYVTEMLKQDNLSLADIDYLLDRHIELVAQRKNIQVDDSTIPNTMIL